MGYPWSIVARPDGVNDDEKNECGLVLLLTDGIHEQEVSRVGFARRHTRNPKVSFEKQLDAEIGKARKAVEILNEQHSNSGVLA